MYTESDNIPVQKNGLTMQKSPMWICENCFLQLNFLVHSSKFVALEKRCPAVIPVAYVLTNYRQLLLQIPYDQNN